MHSLPSSISRNLGRHLHSRAALDRYGLIRRFFTQQTHVPCQPRGILPRRPDIYPNALTASFATSRSQGTSRPSLTLKFARTYVTSNPLPDSQPSKDGNKPTKPPEDLKSHPPEDQEVAGADHEFPHARDHENYSRFFQRLALSLPHPHRPTRDDFLNVATGFWQRLRIRFKWFTVRGFRKFNADDISAFITWFLFSQTLWILVGTTTFFSVVFATANSLRLQRYIARGISDYLTSETGITIIFESAIVPKWKDSRLSFKNVYVSRRPSDSKAKESGCVMKNNFKFQKQA
ncbi:hypothetical protein M413DRAFT_24584 [Hebeloma cylindrosporum]|uniref:Uncharacterized protein n=1 Tax=Hebeloma cylindrosporum TaxID=76867 RepID=A0A0C2Y677_HEBCY|nr:hypothetical protein M413DRAFT_24584 [Hebeloma cylindrosporum h7]